MLVCVVIMVGLTTWKVNFANRRC